MTHIVRGKLIDEQSGQAFAGAPIDVRLMQGDEFVGFVVGDAPPSPAARTPIVPTTEADGSFALALTSGEREGGLFCQTSSVKSGADGDRIRITVGRTECSAYEVILAVQGHASVTVESSVVIIELDDPIAVPPCP